MIEVETVRLHVRGSCHDGPNTHCMFSAPKMWIRLTDQPKVMLSLTVAPHNRRSGKASDVVL